MFARRYKLNAHVHVHHWQVYSQGLHARNILRHKQGDLVPVAAGYNVIICSAHLGSCLLLPLYNSPCSVDQPSAACGGENDVY